MAITINTNATALRTLGNLNSATRGLQGSMNRLSSGLRITKAADDAAGLASAEVLDAHEMSTRQAMRNSNDGISMIQTAESSTSEVANIVKRMRELAVQAASETLASTERAYVQEEFAGLQAEVDRIAVNTEFNGIALGDGSNTQLNVQVGINNSAAGHDQMAITFGDLRATVLGIDTGSVSLSSAANAFDAIDEMDAALDDLNGYRGSLGASQNRLDINISALETSAENMAAGQSQIRDVDFAHETAEMAKMQIMQQANLSLMAQANQMGGSALALL